MMLPVCAGPVLCPPVLRGRFVSMNVNAESGGDVWQWRCCLLSAEGQGGVHQSACFYSRSTATGSHEGVLWEGGGYSRVVLRSARYCSTCGLGFCSRRVAVPRVLSVQKQEQSDV